MLGSILDRGLLLLALLLLTDSALVSVSVASSPGFQAYLELGKVPLALILFAPWALFGLSCLATFLLVRRAHSAWVLVAAAIATVSAWPLVSTIVKLGGVQQLPIQYAALFPIAAALLLAAVLHAAFAASRLTRPCS